MKDIIEQISRIDAVAYQNEQKNNSILLNEKQRYEKEMKKYRDKKLAQANLDARNAYNKILSDAKEENKKQEDKIKKIQKQIENNYVKVEKKVVKEVFNELFAEK